MEHHHQFNQILLMILVVTVTQAAIVHNKFKQLELRQRITGKIGAEKNVRSTIQCSIMCLSTDKCEAYKYKETGPGNCILINENTTAADGKSFEINDSNFIYVKNLCQNGGVPVNKEHGQRCECVDGYLGNHCEEEDNCFSGNNCTDGATCVDGNDTYSCSCVSGYLGNHCEEEDNCFNNNNCTNGATCVDGNGNYSCNCAPGYLGNHCEEEDNCFNGSTCTNGTKCVDEHNDYTCICHQNSGKTWTAPSDWNGTDPVLYRSFDNMDGLVFMEAAKQHNFAPVVSGQVNCAWSLDRTKNQWVDLGIHTEACMTRPETCGSAGGAISFWVKLVDCPFRTGIVSSHEVGTGSLIICHSSSLRFSIYLPDGRFQAYSSVTTTWTQIVLNYLGPNEHEGIRVYYDGIQVASDATMDGTSSTAGYGRIVVARQYTDRDQDYASIQIDELLFFNQILSPDDVMAFNNLVSLRN